MKKTAIILGYVVAVIAAAFAFTASMQVAIMAGLAFLFAFIFFAWSAGAPTVAIATVVFVTIIFPVGMLLLIGSPVYPSWMETLGVIVRASREGGVLSGLEWFIPLLSAAAGLVLAGRVRSDKSPQATRENART